MEYIIDGIRLTPEQAKEVIDAGEGRNVRVYPNMDADGNWFIHPRLADHMTETKEFPELRLTEAKNLRTPTPTRIIDSAELDRLAALDERGL